MEVIKGISVAPGVAIGKAFVLEEVLERVPFHPVVPDQVDHELERFEQALTQAKTDLETDRDQVRHQLGAEPAKIFEFHLGMLHDSTLIEPIRARITEERVTAAYAVAEAFRALADQFRAMGSEVFRQKANDIFDLDRRLLGKLVRQSRDRLAEVEEPVLVISHDLTPAQVAMLDIAHVRGFATDAGGRTSHSAIVAAALGFPWSSVVSSSARP